MQIGATSSYLPTFGSSAASSTSASNSSDEAFSLFAPSKANSPQEDLLRFLKMTPAQKMQYQWLASHKMSDQDLKAMSTEDRAAILKQMATELAEKARQNAITKDSGQGQQLNILA